MILKYSSLDCVAEARKAEAWDLCDRNLDWGFESIIRAFWW
jgi:hypothetical protein